MLLPLLLATGMLVFGLNIQALIMAWLVERLPRLAEWAVRGKRVRRFVGVLDLVLLHVLGAAMVQIAAWALIFRVVGEFHDYPAAFYHSAVNFTTLGYGDLVMSPRWRLLGPLEALNGGLVLGLSSAILVSTFGHLRDARHGASHGLHRQSS
ncbi:Ion transport 2 domain protein [Chthoniobacter flavus Ellin428]|uniref:Ion transport 2 domain protein n=1 Tax=Chthoniobacter flavus Ellin428 TaxID=497964 RepID=B4CYN6_9BACT|nr:ion channel [Chthoniobacter flavus]EDY20577.1 Ion transport 2 domain protein [Chthoniobacter flavus Ellin428]TCO89909.1 ion channel [Chthoniobacter flavus]